MGGRRRQHQAVPQHDAATASECCSDQGKDQGSDWHAPVATDVWLGLYVHQINYSMN